MGIVEETEHPLVIDSGCTVSCINVSIVPHLESTAISVSGIEMKTATSDPVKVLGRSIVTIVIGGVRIRFPILLASGLGNTCILGNDFLLKYQCLLNYWKRTLSLYFPHLRRRIRVPFMQAERDIKFGYSPKLPTEDTNPLTLEGVFEDCESEEMVRVVCAEHTIIPPRGQRLLKVTIDGCMPDKCIMEPNTELFENKKLVVPFGCITNGDIKEVLVANFASKPVTLDKGNYIGKIEEIVEVKCEKPVSIKQGNQEVINILYNENCSFDESKLNINPDLTKEQHSMLINLLREYNDRFAWNSKLMGKTTLCEHTIDTGNNPPVHQAPYRVSHAEREIIRQQVSEMLDNDVIRESRSAYASPVVLVRKKDDTWRFCVDYRALNATLTSGDENYPLPLIDDILSYLNGCQWFTGLDLFSGYWQIPIKESDKHKSAFITSEGLWEFNVLPFGMKTSPATFQRCMDQVLAGLKWGSCLCYLDDLIVMADEFQTHLERLRLVLERLRSASLTLKPSKCLFGYKELKILGHVVSAKGILPDPAKITAIREFPPPRRLRNLRSFLGLANYYRKFVKDFTKITKPLTLLTRKDINFHWTDEQQNAFENLKSALTSSPVLRHFDEKLPIEVHTDASDLGLGASLVQREDGETRPVLYASRRLSDAEVKYNTTQKELLAIVWAVGLFRQYLWGKRFDVVVDHHALCWLNQSKDINGRVARWSLKLAEYDYQIKHKSGKMHVVPDCLSRNPHRCVTESEEKEVDEIPTMLLKLEDIVKLQMEDPEIKEIREAIEDPGKATNIMAKSVRSYFIENGILYRKNVVNKGNTKLIVIPAKMRPEVLFECHDSPLTGGHLGFTKTFSKLKNRYFWPRMLKETEQYVKSCIDCQTKKSPKQKPAGLLQPIKVGKPMDRIGIDFLGPFSKTAKGNTFIVVASDYATKWVETKAITGATAAEASQFIVEQIVCKHGCPREILSDRGQAFKSRLLSGITKGLGIRTQFTTAYHPACNGLVEHINGTIAEMLSHYVSTNQRDWDIYLPLVTFSYNTSQHETTKQTPFYLVYGREATLPLDASINHVTNEDDDVDYLLERVRQTRKDVLEIIERNQMKQKKRYDAEHRQVEYKPGQLILVYTPFRKKGRSEKLLHRWHGPYKVVRKASEVNYVISIRKKGGKIEEDTIHVQRLKPYYNR